MSGARLQPEFTFFIDNCLRGNQFRGILTRAGLRVESLHHNLHETHPDASWIPLVSSPPFEWVIVTKDNSILSTPAEFQAVCDSLARLVIFPTQDLTAEEMGERFIGHLPAILAALRAGAAPVVIFLHAYGIEVQP